MFDLLIYLFMEVLGWVIYAVAGVLFFGAVLSMGWAITWRPIRVWELLTGGEERSKERNDHRSEG